MESPLFEDFSEGQRFMTRGRVVTGTDIDLFATLTGAINPLFLSDEFAASRGFKSRIAPGLLTASLMVGTAYQLGLFDNILALASVERLQFLNPVTTGDALTTEIIVQSKKESKRPDRGFVTLKSICRNQRAETVLEGELTLVYKKKQ